MVDDGRGDLGQALFFLPSLGTNTNEFVTTSQEPQTHSKPTVADHTAIFSFLNKYLKERKVVLARMERRVAGNRPKPNEKGDQGKKHANTDHCQ